MINQKERRLIDIRNCYIYTRVSTIAQIDGYSLDAQMEALKSYAEYKDLRIVGTYCDAGRSGKDIRHRPEFRRMMDDVRAMKNDVNYVLVFKLSRFGRNTADILRSMQVLNDYGVDLVSVNEGIDSSTHGGRLTLAILSAVAEMERENINVQFMAGTLQKIRDGGWAGGTIPYGYRSVNHTLIPDSYEAGIIRKIFKLYEEEGSNASSVARTLNQSGLIRQSVGTDEIKPFTYEFVARILDNPFYCGRLYYNRRTNRKDRNGKPVEPDPDKVIMVHGNHEAIISEDEWDRVQEKRSELAEKHKKSANHVFVHVLSGLLKCPVCGKPLIGRFFRTKNYIAGGYYKKQIAYYECEYHSKQNGRICSFDKKLNQEIVNEIVFRIISNLLYYGEFRKAMESAFGETETIGEKREKLKKLQVTLRDAESLKDRLGEQLDSLNPDRSDYDRKYEMISEKLDDSYDRIDGIEQSIKSERTEIEVLQNKSESYANITEYLKNIGLIIEKMSEEEKKELCRRLIDRIEIFNESRSDGRIIRSIAFRFPIAFDGEESAECKDLQDTFSFVLDCTDIDIPMPDTGKVIMKTLEDGSKRAVIRKPTYTAIRSYIKQTYKANVPTLYIAQIKRKYGLDVGKAYCKSDKPKRKPPKCPPEKEKMILEALKHFGLLDQTTQYKGDEQR